MAWEPQGFRAPAWSPSELRRLLQGPAHLGLSRPTALQSAAGAPVVSSFLVRSVDSDHGGQDLVDHLNCGVGVEKGEPGHGLALPGRRRDETDLVG